MPLGASFITGMERSKHASAFPVAATQHNRHVTYTRAQTKLEQSIAS
jgi:hypothetical protein